MIGLALVASAASAATPARGGGFSFDPASTLPWAVPMLLGIPFVGYIMVLGSVRTRRGAANVAQGVVAVMLLLTLLIGWARIHQTATYKVAYQWINISVAFSGDQRFQGFGVDLSLRLDHWTLAALVTILTLMFCALVWHRVAGRGEQGPVRFQVNVIMLAFGVAGVLVSGDLVELLAFWMTTGLASYLLLGHRWGTEGAGQRGRVALALPFLGDVSLLTGVALLYSRFGTTTMDTLYPALSSTPGVGQKSLTAAALLLVGAVAIRACVWPFTAWQTSTVDAPPAAVALVAGIWPVLAGGLLLRSLPVISAAGPQAAAIAGWTFGVAAVAGPLLALLGVEMRRSLLLASSGAVALALLGVLYPASVGVSLTALLAVAGARTGLLLAAAAAGATLRTTDLRAMGAGWERMPLTTTALLAGAAVVALTGLGPALLRPQSIAWLGFGLGLATVTLAVLRVYFAFAHGPLRRRRAFEPGRVQEVVGDLAWSALIASGLGAAALILSFLTGWVGFLVAGGHAGNMGTNVLWIVAPLAGAAVAGLAFVARKDSSLELGARLGEAVGALWERAAVLYDRFVARPGQRAVVGVEEGGLTGLESGLGGGVARAGSLVRIAERAPWVPTVLGLAVVLAVAFGLLGRIA
jgi:formate hydrogenlyase subunit 3/multisubunit Na+/H+ antiporter MnhD subunit